MKYEMRKLSFGETLGEAFNLYFDNFIALFLISTISYIPAIIFSVMAVPGAASGSTSRNWVNVVMLFVFFIVVFTLSTALIIELVSKKYLKQHQTISQYFRNILPYLLPVIGLTILFVLIIGGPAIFLALIHPGLLVLYIIPAIYFILGLILSVQVLIVERKPVIESMKRSFFLTEQKKLEIFGFMIVLWAINFVAGKMLDGVVLPMIRDMSASFDAKIFIWFVLYFLVHVLIAPISSCIYILIYYNLRIEKEGFDLEHLVDQFGTSEPAAEPEP